MQNTRLNTLVDVLSNRFERWLRNPWRRISLLLISVLLGTFLGTALSTIAGQQADWDILVAGICVLLTEALSWFIYAGNQRWVRSLPIQMLNAVKFGITYSLFVEAFKLGS